MGKRRVICELLGCVCSEDYWCDRCGEDVYGVRGLMPALNFRAEFADAVERGEVARAELPEGNWSNTRN